MGRGKWTGDNNPNAFLTAEQKRALAKRLTEARYRKQAAQRALQMQEQMAELRAIADALWGGLATQAAESARQGSPKPSRHYNRPSVI
jgi:hypothetical protein